jgi:hypothetical protein
MTKLAFKSISGFAVAVTLATSGSATAADYEPVSTPLDVYAGVFGGVLFADRDVVSGFGPGPNLTKIRSGLPADWQASTFVMVPCSMVSKAISGLSSAAQVTNLAWFARFDGVTQTGRLTYGAALVSPLDSWTCLLLAA